MEILHNKINPKIVVIGGGTGNSVILRGLKDKTKNISAIVAMGDNGGSTGVLREDLGMLPPGDIRACLLALSNTESSMEDLFKYRFDKGSLSGQSLGNLILAALNEIHGSFEKAVLETSNILNITGKIYPMTMENVNLKAKYENGGFQFGESEIPIYASENNTKIDYVELEPSNPKPMDGSLKSIKDADIILLGPGSLYTSVIPNLLVDGVVDSINKSNAIVVYVSNIMTQDGETNDYSVSDHVKALFKHAPNLRLDKVIINNKKIDDEKIVEKYKKKNQILVSYDENDKKYFDDLNIDVVQAEIMDNDLYVKHNANKISDILINIFIDESDTKMFEI